MSEKDVLSREGLPKYATVGLPMDGRPGGYLEGLPVCVAVGLPMDGRSGGYLEGLPVCVAVVLPMDGRRYGGRKTKKTGRAVLKVKVGVWLS